MRELVEHLKTHQLKMILYYWERANVPNAEDHAVVYRDELERRNAGQRKNS